MIMTSYSLMPYHHTHRPKTHNCSTVIHNNTITVSLSESGTRLSVLNTTLPLYNHQNTKYSPPGYPFGPDVSLNFWTRLCSDVFGPEFNKERLERGIKQTVKSYGGLKINATNVFFVSGSTDPWHSLAITGDTAASSKGGWSTLISYWSRSIKTEL